MLRELHVAKRTRLFQLRFHVICLDLSAAYVTVVFNEIEGEVEENEVTRGYLTMVHLCLRQGKLQEFVLTW